MSDVYKSMFGKLLWFNDPVKIMYTLLPESECIGRLVQVRKSCGAWGTDIFFIRKPDGVLHTFENAGIEKFTKWELPVDETDSTEVEYTIKGQWGETGFVIEEPKQPQSYSPPFSIAVQQGNN